MTGSTQSVNTLLDTIDAKRKKHGKVTIGSIQEAAGHRVSGPMLLIPGLAITSPLSGIPTLPTILAAVIGLVSAQLLAGRTSIWLPERLRKAGVSSAKAGKAIAFLRPAAKFTDRISRKRLKWLSGPLAIRTAGFLCLLVALVMPPLEFIPFSNSAAGFLVALVGLALTVNDGLIFGLTFAAFGLAAGLGVMALF